LLPPHLVRVHGHALGHWAVGVGLSARLVERARAKLGGPATAFERWRALGGRAIAHERYALIAGVG
jgi:hypothetical protein